MVVQTQISFVLPGCYVPRSILENFSESRQITPGFLLELENTLDYSFIALPKKNFFSDFTMMNCYFVYGAQQGLVFLIQISC